MLKISSALVAVALTAGAAYAEDTRFDVDLYRGNPILDSSYTQASASRYQNARAAFAYAPGSERTAHASAFVVHRNGQYVGQDPDYNVRLDLQRETEPR